MQTKDAVNILGGREVDLSSGLFNIENNLVTKQNYVSGHAWKILCATISFQDEN